MEAKDLLLPLVGALWACSTFVLPMAFELNKIRDRVIIGIDGGNALTKAHRQLLLENDWNPLNRALIIVCSLFGLVCLASPFLLSKTQRKSLAVWVPVLFVALVPIGVAIAWALGMSDDRSAMKVAIAAVANASSSSVTNASSITTNNLQPAKPIEALITSNPSIGITDAADIKTPFNAATVAVSHSALCAVMAGFALAGLFLLIERSDGNKPTARLHSRAMLALFVSFLTGGLAAYLYSSITGDPPIRSYFLFLFPSVIMALHVFSLFSGINFALAAFQVDDSVRRVARVITYFVVPLVIYIEGSDLYAAVGFFSPASGARQTAMIWVIALGSILALIEFILRRRRSRYLSFLNFSSYCYAILAVSIIASGIECMDYLAKENEIRLGIFVPTLLFVSIAAVGGWTCQMIGSETKMHGLSAATTSPVNPTAP